MSALRPDRAITIRDFSAGFQDTPEQDTLPPGASPDCKNGVLVSGQISSLGTRAILQRRQGAELLNPTAIGVGHAIDGMTAFRRETFSDELLAVCDGKLVTWNAATSTFDQIGATAPFTAGNAARFAFHRNQAYISDGSDQVRYNGTALLPIGFYPPTAAPTLTADAPAGTGVTGTYEGYAVWYDSVTGHESSPSATSAQVVHTNQDRRWLKPAGTPPANVTHWRIYCRRVDTHEVQLLPGRHGTRRLWLSQ